MNRPSLKVQDPPAYAGFRHYWTLFHYAQPVVGIGLGVLGTPLWTCVFVACIVCALVPEFWLFRANPGAVLRERADLPRELALYLVALVWFVSTASLVTFHVVGQLVRYQSSDTGAGLSPADTLPYGVLCCGLFVLTRVARAYGQRKMPDWLAEADRRRADMHREIRATFDPRLLALPVIRGRGH